jgi:valyl-tRNA synthetase
VIADSYVDPKFALGALKVTPGHDPNDFEIGKRHSLPVLTVMNEDGTMNSSASERYRGLDRFEARKRVVEDLKALGLLEKHEKHVHSVGTCSRSGTIVEPRVSVQWWVRMKDMAAEAVRAVETKRIELLPEYQEKIFFEWMDNIQDWCISRQLWWGHRIPVWYCDACGTEHASDEDLAKCPKCGSVKLRQDPDVLDTWFSSGLWPFSTMGWPEQTEALRTFYPTSVLVTGYDILFFWVARMIMLGQKMLGEVPFRQVFLHGLLRDEHGEKMSKTKGNGIDPLEAIDEFGADALRFTLAAQSVMGRDMILQRSTIEGYRNFVNKIWNAHRFLVHHWERLPEPPPKFTPSGPFETWITRRLEIVSFEVNLHLKNRRFDEACREVYSFVWHEYCDWYLEIAKPVLYGDFGPEPQSATLATLRHVFDASIRLLHPFMPFVTEELWSRLPKATGSIMVAEYPMGRDLSLEQAPELYAVQQFMQVIESVRHLRGEQKIPPKVKVQPIVLTSDPTLRSLIEREHTIFCSLTSSAAIELPHNSEFRAWQDKLQGQPVKVESDFTVYVVATIPADAAKERERLWKEWEKTRDKIAKLQAKLENSDFLSKAPPSVVEKNKEDLLTLETQASKLNDSIRRISPS